MSERIGLLVRTRREGGAAMPDDLFGLKVAAAPAALEPWRRTVLAFLSHGSSLPEHLARTIEADPRFAMAQAARGLFLMLLGRAELLDGAREALAAARAGTPASAREAAYADALSDWLDGRPSGAVAHLDVALAAAPGDALAMKIAHSVRFTLGDAAGMRGALEAAAPSYGPGHPAEGYFLGCTAFALEETGEYAAAERAGRAALEIASDDAWGLHAVAHVHEMTHAPEAGIAWLEAREASFAHCNNFRFHVWWHKALMHLDRGEHAAVLALYDKAVRAERTDDWRDISNAASLLMRLELDGAKVGDRWEEIAALSAKRTDDACMIFADLHYLMSLLGAGRAGDAGAMLARIARTAEGNCETSRRTARPGLPVAEGLAAFAAGDHAAAWRSLSAAIPDLQGAGGSHAQRDVFERIAADAGIRSGNLAGAEALLRSRINRRGGHEDGFGAARRAMIDAARAGADVDLHAAE